MRLQEFFKKINSIQSPRLWILGAGISYDVSNGILPLGDELTVKIEQKLLNIKDKEEDLKWLIEKSIVAGKVSLDFMTAIINEHARIDSQKVMQWLGKLSRIAADIICDCCKQLCDSGYPQKSFYDNFLNKVVRSGDIIASFNWDPLLDWCLMESPKFAFNPLVDFGINFKPLGNFAFPFQGKDNNCLKIEYILPHGSVAWFLCRWFKKEDDPASWSPYGNYYVLPSEIQKGWSPYSQSNGVSLVGLPEFILRLELFQKNKLYSYFDIQRRRLIDALIKSNIVIAMGYRFSFGDVKGGGYHSWLFWWNIASQERTMHPPYFVLALKPPETKFEMKKQIGIKSISFCKGTMTELCDMLQHVA